MFSIRTAISRYTHSTLLLLRDQMLGKYKVLEPLGSGGFGSVYLAHDTWIDKKVAIKVPHRQNLDFGELLKEPRLLASLNHPNVVSIITAEKQNDIFFIVMEYVSGATLEQIIETEGALELSRGLDYICQICNAVDHAHAQGVLHRDLRPGNVLVSRTGLLKVADFGTARFLEIAAHGSTVIGSPAYMAPEVFDGKAVFASDIYSLGCTMYQILTGSAPYAPPAPKELDKLMSGELVSAPRLKNPNIPTRVSEIIMRAMAPNISERYKQANDVLTDLLDGRPENSVRRTHSNQTSNHERPLSVSSHASDTPQQRFCWHCRKPLAAKTDRCPFCREMQ
ncbi:MAG: serine/threonine-protein kinase [Acidobacteriota bacterium]|nr:serine/threonine-protein kinase [Acidobacteriota bacterium]